MNCDLCGVDDCCSLDFVFNCLCIFIDRVEKFFLVNDYLLCLFSSEFGYIISLCMGLFYIFGVIMVIVYYKIYKVVIE